MSVAQQFLVLAILAALSGLISLVIGLRGRREGTHPFCRRCDFDLFGLPADQPACPECGASLSLPRARVIGARQRRSKLLAAGIALLIMGLTPLGIVGWGTFREIDWEHYKPVAWLLHDARGSDAVAQQAALKELVRRQSTGGLTSEQTEALVEDGLKVQGDTKRVWNAAWGDLIEGAHAAGSVSDAQWTRYATQAVSTGWLTAHVPAKWRAGQTPMVSVHASTTRVGRRGPYAVIRHVKTIVDDRAFEEPPGGYMMISLSAAGAVAGSSGSANVDLASLSVGTHSGFVVAKVRVTDETVLSTPGLSSPFVPAAMPPSRRPAPGDPRDTMAWLKAQHAAHESFAASARQRFQAERAKMDAIASGTDGSPTYADVELKLPIQFDVVGPDQPTAKAVTDEQFRARIESALSVEDVTCMGTSVHLTVKCAGHPPVPLCFKVVLREGTQEWTVGHANFGAGMVGRTDEQWVVGEINDALPPTAGKVDVALRPDVEADEFGLAPEVDSYWGREVVLKDVAVEYPFRDHERGTLRSFLRGRR